LGLGLGFGLVRSGLGPVMSTLIMVLRIWSCLYLQFLISHEQSLEDNERLHRRAKPLPASECVAIELVGERSNVCVDDVKPLFVILNVVTDVGRHGARPRGAFERTRGPHAAEYRHIAAPYVYTHTYTYTHIHRYIHTPSYTDTHKKEKKEVDLYSAFIEVPYTQGVQVRITQCFL